VEFLLRYLAPARLRLDIEHCFQPRETRSNWIWCVAMQKSLRGVQAVLAGKRVCSLLWAAR